MLASFYSIAFILLALALGYVFGKLAPVRIKNFCTQSISTVVFLLLFLMGIDIGWVFVDDKVDLGIFLDALAFSLLISSVIFFLLIKTMDIPLPSSSKNTFIAPLLGCLKAISAFVIGILCYKYLDGKFILEIVNIDQVLYLLIFLVGADLVSFNIRQLGYRHLKVPLLTLLGTAGACCVYSIISDRSLQDLLLASSGHGWFTLSGPMISTLRGPELGLFAFLTDLFREILSIIFLYLLGTRYSHSAIGISGAAALDSVLPFIKENCQQEDIDYAIASGFILTLMAPLLISIFSII